MLQLVRFPTPARRKGRNRDSGSSKKHKPNLKGDAPSAPSIFKKTRQVYYHAYWAYHIHVLPAKVCRLNSMLHCMPSGHV